MFDCEIPPEQEPPAKTWYVTVPPAPEVEPDRVAETVKLPPTLIVETDSVIAMEV
jgi:hypothetical protein